MSVWFFFLNVFRRSDRFLLVSQKETSVASLHFINLLQFLGSLDGRGFINASVAFYCLKANPCVMHKRPKVCPRKGCVTGISDLPWSCLFPTEQRSPEHCVPGRALRMAARVLLYPWGVAGVCSSPWSVCTSLFGGCRALLVVEYHGNTCCCCRKRGDL